MLLIYHINIKWIYLFILLINIIKIGLSSSVPCIEDNKFYRNPNRSLIQNTDGSYGDCAKYYLCLDNEVFEFKCSEGLVFDVVKQICSSKENVNNCNQLPDQWIQSDKLEDNCANDRNGSYLICDDGITCIPSGHFCDGSEDCPDSSDEQWCSNENDINAATPCNPQSCLLPNCWCSPNGRKIPGNLTSSSTPQMILISFNSAVNGETFNSYLKLFDGKRKNPNGCPIRATFYVSHEYTNYRDVQYLWNAGHEIAVHSLSNREPEEWWSNNATIENWFDEMVGQANIIKQYGKVRIEEIKGLRVPFLQVGWNRQFLMMSEFGFLYDSSIIAPFSHLPVWPYTLDHRLPHQCSTSGQLCPSRSHPGLWELPINQILAGEYICDTIESCTANSTDEEIYEILMFNFKRHYLSNRAPLILHFNSVWFQNLSNVHILTKFVDDLLKFPDVYFVTSQQVVEWMRNPTSISDLMRFTPWQCPLRKFYPDEIACEFPNNCKLPSNVFNSFRYLNTCSNCPKQYPWLRNEFGNE